MRLAGEGDLLAQLDRLRRALHAEGLFEPQKALPRPVLPRTIGVVTGEGGKARDDVLAGLRRRGWGGRVVWAFAPVQDRHAAPRITQALQDLAAVDEVEVIVVARGGGSLADLFAFCDETLCRTVAMLRVPVIASVGHHTDRTLIDDVAAVSCSTPTHAAESAVPLHCGEARASIARCAAALQRHGRHAVVVRARALAQLSRAPAEHVARHRARLHQWLREIRAAGRRGCDRRRRDIDTRAIVLEPQGRRGARARAEARRGRLDSLAAAIAAHDPERVLARGYAMVEDRAGEVVTTAAAARAARRRAPALQRCRRGCEDPGGGSVNETTQHTYETATARLEEIIRRLDSGEAGLRETLDLCKEGRELVEFCAAELDAVGQGLEELRLDELVARLEQRPAE